VVTNKPTNKQTNIKQNNAHRERANDDTHKNVFRLDVAVDELVAVQVRDAVQRVSREAAPQLPRQRHLLLAQYSAQVCGEVGAAWTGVRAT
jgi:hypothetical protein